MLEAEKFSSRFEFSTVDWKDVPESPSVYVIYDADEVLYVGMAGRNGRGNLRNRLRDHGSGSIVNMFAQYLFLARVQFTASEPVTHPRAAKNLCRQYIRERCSFCFIVTESGTRARELEVELKQTLRPALNPTT